MKRRFFYRLKWASFFRFLRLCFWCGMAFFGDTQPRHSAATSTAALLLMFLGFSVLADFGAMRRPLFVAAVLDHNRRWLLVLLMGGMQGRQSASGSGHARQG